MGTRAAGGYVGMSEGWLGTVCALFLRSFNAATTSLIGILESGLGFRGRSSTDHPGPDGPVAVQTRIWGAGPDPGAGPDQVFRARSRGFRALGREFSKGFLNEIFLAPEKIFPAGLDSIPPSVAAPLLSLRVL